MGEANAEHIQGGGCCHDAVGSAASEVACSGHATESGAGADVCGAEGGCCGGGGHSSSMDDLFAFPTTTEQVTIPAVQLAGLLDLVEKLAEDPAVLRDELDYEQAQRLLAAQAPQLVQLRDEFLERMKSLLAEAQLPG